MFTPLFFRLIYLRNIESTKPIASPATLHRKLDELREGGLIEQTFEGKNRRTKYLCPTPQAEKYFSQVGAVMQQAGLKTA